MKQNISAVTVIALWLMFITKFILPASCNNLIFFISDLADRISYYPQTGGFPIFLPPHKWNIRYLVTDGTMLPGKIADGNDLEIMYR